MHGIIGSKKQRRVLGLSQADGTTGHGDQMGNSDIAKPETAEPRQRLSRARCRLLEMSLQEASFAEGTPRPVQVEKRAHLVGQRDGLLQEIDSRPILLVL